MARSSPSGFARGFSPLPGEVRRSASASPLITPPRVELPSSLSGTVPPLGTSLIAAVPPAVPPLGSNLIDLRSTVVAQQRQLDGLVDKVASLLSAMHAEVLEDVRKTCRHGGGLENGSAPGMDTKDLVHFRELRETEGSLRAWMQGQLRENWERLEGKLREVQYHMSNEVRDVQGHIAGEVHSLRARVSHLEDMTLDDDDNDPAELRQHLEVRLEAQTAQVHSTMGQLAAELRQQLEAGPAEHFAEDVLRRVDGRLQEHEAKDGILGKLRDDLRQEAEVRLEAKMTQTFGLAQRLMNELRQELQGQVVQVHETSQHLAVELRRGLETQQLHLQASLQQFAREGFGRGAGGGAAAGDGAGGRAAVEEQLAGCRAAAADCARCAIETAEATDHMEAQLESFMQRVSQELHEDLVGQQQQVRKSLREFAQEELQKGLGELSRTTAEGARSAAGDSTAVEASVAELEEELAKVHAALADSAQVAREASSKSSTVESGLRELSQRLPGELRRDCEAQEARLSKSLQEQVQEAVRKGLESTQASLSESRGSSDVPTAGGGAAAAAAVEEELAKVRAEAASSTRNAAEASAKAEAVESGLQELSKRLAGDLKQSAEAQEARLGESLRQLVRDEVQQGLGSAAASREAPVVAASGASPAGEEQLAACKAVLADCTRCAGEASAKADSMESRFGELSDRLTSKLHEDAADQESRIRQSLLQVVGDEVQKNMGEAAGPEAATAGKHLAGCKAAAADCSRYLTEALTEADSVEARLKTCGEELQAQLGAEGRRLLGELAAARPAAAAAGAAGAGAPAAAAEGGGEAPTVLELAQRLGELDEEVGSHRMLLVALRERVLQEGEYQEGDEESPGGTPSGGSPSGRSPVAATVQGVQGGMLGGRSARSASGSSDGS